MHWLLGRLPFQVFRTGSEGSCTTNCDFQWVQENHVSSHWNVIVSMRWKSRFAKQNMILFLIVINVINGHIWAQKILYYIKISILNNSIWHNMTWYDETILIKKKICLAKKETLILQNFNTLHTSIAPPAHVWCCPLPTLPWMIGRQQIFKLMEREPGSTPIWTMSKNFGLHWTATFCM